MTTPIDIKATVVGGVQVEARFLTGRERVREYVIRETRGLTIRLQRKVKEEKLSGQVLKVRTGRGKRSINQRVDVLGDQVVGRVGTWVDYMADWERVGKPAIDIFPVRAKALRWIGASGQPVFAAHVHQPAKPPRPFLRPSLTEMRPEIQMRIARAAFLGV